MPIHGFTIRVTLLSFVLTVLPYAKEDIVGKIVKEANTYIGDKYVWGGNTLGKGVDCSSFVKELYKKHGYTLPRRAVWQVVDTKSCPTYYDFSDLRIGDTIYFKKKTSKEIDHVALITGFSNNNLPIMTHAKSKKDGIVREVMSEKYANRAVAIKRFSECSSPLGKGYQDTEVASAILFYAKKHKVKKINIYKYLIEKSNMRPNLIRVRLYNKNKARELISYLRGTKHVDAVYENYSGNVVIDGLEIKKTIQILKELKENKYIFFIGIGGVDSRKLSLSDMNTILYPHVNIGKLFKHNDVARVIQNWSQVSK